MTNTTQLLMDATRPTAKQYLHAASIILAGKHVYDAKGNRVLRAAAQAQGKAE